MTAVCPNQLHDALVSVSALQQVIFLDLCPTASFHLTFAYSFFFILLQFSSPERFPSPDRLADHHSDASLCSAHSSDSEDSFNAKRKQHYRMGAALKGPASMGM